MSAITRPAPAVENPVERSGDALAHTVEHGATPPVAAAELQRLLAVGREDPGRLCGQRGALDLLVGFQVPAKAPTVEIARAEAHPVVAERHLAVQHPRLILENTHAAAQHLAVEAPRRMAHPRMVGLRPRHQQSDIDPASRGAPQPFAEAPRRYEIGAHDPRAPLRAIDPPHDVIGQEGAMPGLAQRESAERSGRNGGFVRRLRRRLGDRRRAAAATAVAREGGRPVTHHRSRDLQHEVTPGEAAACAVNELVGQAHAAHEGQCTVNHEELAVIPQEVLQALAQGERIEESQVRAGIAEPTAVRRTKSQRAEAVEEHMDAHAALRTSGKRIDESPRYRAGFDQIHLEQHRLARGRDGLEHSPEDAIALGEQAEAVALPPRPAGGDSRRRMRLDRQPDSTLSARHAWIFYALRAALILAVFCPLPARANAVAAVNRARITYCGLPRTSHHLLAESRELDEVARLLAQGESLGQAELHTGYRAARSFWIEISGARDDVALEQMLSQRFCAQLTDPSLMHVGVFGRGADRLWIVLAQPFTTPATEDSDDVSRLVLALTNQARARGRTCGAQSFPPAPPLSLAPD